MATGSARECAFPQGLLLGEHDMGRFPAVAAAMGASRIAAAVAGVLLIAGGPAAAQERPADLQEVPPVPTDFTPDKLPWGDWDFTGIWPHEQMQQGGILFQRPPQYGNHAWVNDEEFALRLEAARQQDGNFTAATETGIGTAGTAGLAQWFLAYGMGKRSSLLVDPADGQLPALTPEGQRLFEEGRSGWVPGQHYDWVSDFDTWDRCITRGFPASMFPNRYNNSFRVFQSPGSITILLEMLGRRVIPIVEGPEAARAWPDAPESWMGNSVAYWDDRTLVIETKNIVSGDGVTHDPHARSAAPVIVTMIGGAPFNTIAMSDKARTVERLTMIGPDAIMHELTYSDPEIFTVPWTARTQWTRDEDYVSYEYACHEGNYAIRDYISASRGQRENEAAGIVEQVTAENDDRGRFLEVFDWDPGTGPRQVFGAGGN